MCASTSVCVRKERWGHTVVFVHSCGSSVMVPRSHLENQRGQRLVGLVIAPVSEPLHLGSPPGLSNDRNRLLIQPVTGEESEVVCSNTQLLYKPKSTDQLAVEEVGLPAVEAAPGRETGVPVVLQGTRQHVTISHLWEVR